MRELLQYLEQNARTLTLYGYTGTDEQLHELSQWLGGYGIRVQVAETVDAPHDSVAVLHRGETVIGTCAGQELLDRVKFETAITDGKAPPVPEMVASLSSDVTVQPSQNVEEMVRVSREFERRALRERAGTLHAGFQQLSQIATSERTLNMYTALANRGVTVRVYGYPDITLDAVPFTVVEDEDGELERHWFLLYDGNDNPHRKAALVSEERSRADERVDFTSSRADGNKSTGVYDSFFTTDAEMVDELLTRAREAYGDLVAPAR